MAHLSSTGSDRIRFAVSSVVTSGFCVVACCLACLASSVCFGLSFINIGFGSADIDTAIKAIHKPENEQFDIRMVWETYIAR